MGGERDLGLRLGCLMTCCEINKTSAGPYVDIPRAGLRKMNTDRGNVSDAPHIIRRSRHLNSRPLRVSNGLAVSGGRRVLLLQPGLPACGM